MKKILSLVLMLLGGVAMLTSCESDNDSNPTIKSPTTFTINASPVADQYIQLAQNNNVNLTWTQPNYGYNAFATYKVQVGLVKNGAVTWYEKDGQPKYLATTYTVCNANISGEEISEVLCAIDGFKYAEDYVDQGYREVTLRVYASINTSMKAEIEGTGILSDNYVTFKHMAAYNAVKGIGTIWLIGSCGGWKEPSAANAEALEPWIIYETEIGSKIYKGTFKIEAGDLTFRFYTKLTGWDGGASIGHKVNDEATECTFSADGSFADKYVSGKGSWQFNGFPGGDLEITIDMNASTVKFVIL